jgi:hypothetical protein
MKRGFGLVWALLTLAIVGLASWFAYGAGLAQATTAVPRDGTAVYPPYYYHYGFGFGFFPFLFFILILFLVFRRPWGHRHWGGGHGYPWRGYYWHGPGHEGSPDLPPPIEDRMRAWHDRAHGAPASNADPGPAGQDPPTG